ncbi:MAG: nucleotidyltransferase family protein [Ruminococcus sp.]|nr:nucleotidyltransferase family protein [Ruminococcus sp.]
MNKHDYKQNAYYLMYLIRCVLNDNIPAKEKLDKMNLSGVFAVAKAHSLTAIAAYALESAGIYDKAFEEEKNKAIRKEIIFDVERNRVFAELEKEGIWYMPLKGIILKDLYPQIGMRQMADNDILYDKNCSEKVKCIMQGLGFSTELYDGSNHDIYHKPPVCNFEMHTEVFGDWHEEKLYDYYVKIKDRLVKDPDNNSGYFLTKEDFYIYTIAHAYKHYAAGGTGLRTIVDTYLYYKSYQDTLNMKYIESECVKLGVAQFEKQLRELSMHLFGGYKLTEEERQCFDYIVFSGTYGTVQNSVKNKLKNSHASASAKLNIIKNRLFVPIRKSDPQYKAYAARYKWFYKSKARVPLLFFYRIGAALTSRKGRAKAELRAIVKAK